MAIYSAQSVMYGTNNFQHLASVSEQKKRQLLGVPSPIFACIGKQPFLLLCVAQRQHYSVSEKKEFSFFRLSSQDCLQMAAVCCCFRSSFYSRIFDVFGDMLLVHFYSLGFWKSFVKEFMGPKKYLNYLYNRRCCDQTPPRQRSTDPKPVCHFDPLLMEIDVSYRAFRQEPIQLLK